MKLPLLVIFLFSVIVGFSQQDHPDEFNLLFYNLENLFDTFDDPQTSDDEFVASGDRHWTRKKFQTKISNISKVIVSSCDYQMPDVVGLCEVENRFVLNELINKTPLKKFNYKIIHKDSPDRRGIDVALIYRTEKCEPLYFEYIPLLDDDGNTIRSREILYAQFYLFPEDTLHVFFNHWPSRYGGQTETEQKRIRAANQLKERINRLNKEYQNAKVLVMGDFNDDPKNKSMTESLQAKSVPSSNGANQLVNLSAIWDKMGTLKHRQNWVVFDQILVSDYLLEKQQGWFAKQSDAQTIKLNFLFENDPKFQGKRLFRTYYGMKYKGGFSDHLPIRLKLSYPD